MSPSLRRIGAACATVGALALAAIGCGGATTGQSASAAASQPGYGQPAGQPGQGGGPDLSALAEKLGVTEAKLRRAMQSARPDRGSDPSDMTAAIAKALGVSEAKVTAAMQATRPSGTPPQDGASQGEVS